jgi:hypothetical protein
VRLDSAGYHVGATTYPARGNGVYSGRAGAVVITSDPGGVERAGASTHVDAVPMLGLCSLEASAAIERCSFRFGGRFLRATDRFRDGGWDRRYNDGDSTRIPLESTHPIPVPFALGR